MLVKWSICVVTDPHTDGRKTPARPVHHVEEQETRHRDEVQFWKLSKNKSLCKQRWVSRCLCLEENHTCIIKSTSAGLKGGAERFGALSFMKDSSCCRLEFTATGLYFNSDPESQQREYLVIPWNVSHYFGILPWLWVVWIKKLTTVSVLVVGDSCTFLWATKDKFY